MNTAKFLDFTNPISLFAVEPHAVMLNLYCAPAALSQWLVSWAEGLCVILRLQEPLEVGAKRLFTWENSIKIVSLLALFTVHINCFLYCCFRVPQAPAVKHHSDYCSIINITAHHTASCVLQSISGGKEKLLQFEFKLRGREVLCWEPWG